MFTTLLRGFCTDDWATGLFYIAYGAVLIPWFGVADSYGGLTPEYYNAFGFFFVSKYMSCFTMPTVLTK